MAARKNQKTKAPVKPVILNDGIGVKPVVKVEISIRPANVLDSVALLTILYRYFDDLKFAYPQIDPGDALKWGIGLIQQNLVFLAMDGHTIVGSVGMEVGTFPWNTKFRYFNGVWFYVAPERRAGGTAGRLMKAAKDVAAANAMPLRLDNIWGIEPELQDRFREIHGFKHVGGNHVWFPPLPEPKA